MGVRAGVVRERDARARTTMGRVVSEGMGRGRTDSNERDSQRAATMIPPVDGYRYVSAVREGKVLGSDGLLCSCRRGVSFSGLRNSAVRSVMSVSRSNWVNLPGVGLASVAGFGSMVGFVSMMMLGVRCRKLCV